MGNLIHNNSPFKESIPQKGSGQATTKKLQRRKDGTGNYKRPKDKEQYADSNQYSAAGLTDLKVRRQRGEEKEDKKTANQRA